VAESLVRCNGFRLGLSSYLEQVLISAMLANRGPSDRSGTGINCSVMDTDFRYLGPSYATAHVQASDRSGRELYEIYTFGLDHSLDLARTGC